MTVVVPDFERSMEELNRRATEVAGALNVAHANAIELVADALESGAWFQAGIRSPEHWLAWQMGVSPSRASAWVAMARRRAELPVTFQAFDNGELAVDQVSVVVNHIPTRHDAQACRLAKMTMVTQLRSALSRYRFDPPPPAPATDPSDEPESEASSPEPEAAPSAPAGRDVPPTNGEPPPQRPYLTRWFDDDGNFYLTLRANADDGAIIDLAVQEAHDRLFQSGQRDVSQLDAMVDVCNRSLDAIVSRDRRDRFRAYVHVDTEGGWLNAGPRLPDHLLSELLCDSVVHPVWTVKGVPINVGPSTPVIPDHLRRIVLDRDRVCRCCGSSLGIHLHHVVHREHLGPTQSGNLVGLCSRCHRAHHRGEIIVSLAAGTDADDPDGLIITRADGSRFGPAPPIPPPGGRPPGPPDGHRYAHPLGERMDFDAIVFNEPPFELTTALGLPSAP